LPFDGSHFRLCETPGEQGECWANTILGTTDFVTNLEDSKSGLVTRTISKKKSNSKNKRKHRVEFLYVIITI